MDFFADMICVFILAKWQCCDWVVKDKNVIMFVK